MRTVNRLIGPNAVRRTFALAAILGSLCWGAACSSPSDDDSPGAGGRESGFGILLITVDGLVPHTLEPFGGAATVPHLKALISEGRAWGDAWTASPMTRPAVTTYLTGLTPDRHAVWDDYRDRLESDVPTLAGLLGANGFRTAAFPDAACLGFASGLLDEFEVVDEPPAMAPGIQRWRRDPRDSAEQVEHFSTWLSSIDGENRWFAWLHVSSPALTRIGKDDMAPGPEGPAAFDEWLGEIRGVVGRVRRDDAVAIAVAGTYADSRGMNGGVPGVGMSIGEAAVAVPVVLRFPSGVDPIPEGAGPVWAPDVPVTLAALAGVSIVGSEGRDLTRATNPERTLYSWSLAPRDQLGWRPVAAARHGEERARSDGSVATDSLGQQLAARPVVLRPAASAALREALTRRGLRPRPVPPEGRAFGPATRRRDAARSLLDARDRLQSDDLSGARDALRRLAAIDPDSLAGLLETGLLQMMGGDSDAARRSLSRAAELYPDDPESVHWYVHATWDPSDPGTEELLRLILPERATDPDLLYDIACLRSLEGDIPSSEQFLRSAIEAGFRQWGHMEADPDLRALRESGRFAAVMRDLRQ